jgi:hypothetical protein
MYFSGAYFVAKKKVMLEIPLDETRGWGEGEDVVWSAAFTRKYEFSMNPLSSVALLKQKDRAFSECSQDTVDRLARI